jgi:putative aldouronate transport system substrate-binding protein
MKKLFVTFLTLLMVISNTSVLAFNETGYPISDEVITVTLSAPTGGKTDWSEFALFAEMEKRLGIRLECTVFSHEVWATQFTLMLASDELPDIIIDNGLSLAEVSDLGSQGYFMALNDLIEQYAPNIAAMMEKYPDLKMYSTSADGNMYTIVGLGESTLGTVNRCWINRRWLENLGLAYPTSVEELKEVLVAFRDKDANGNGDPNDEIPMSNFNNHMQKLMVNNFGISSTNGIYLLEEVDGKVVLGETTDNYKAYLKYMKNLWDENLLDHDNFIQTNEEFHSKASQELVGTFFDWAPFVAAGKALDYDQNFYWLGALRSEFSTNRVVYQNSHVIAQPYFLINANTQYAKEIIRMIDYFFSEEGQLAGKYGYEGMNYDMVYLDIPGLEEYGVLKIRQPEGYSSTEDYRNNAVTPGEIFSPYLPAAGTYHAMAMVANAEQLEALLPMYGWGILVARDCLSNPEIDKVAAFPTLLYTEDESAERTSLYTDISLYIESMHAQFITGVTDIDAGWDTFIDTLNSMQLPRLLEIEQAAYDRLVGK